MANVKKTTVKAALKPGAKAAAKAGDEEESTGRAMIIPTLKSKALSLEVGPKIVAALAAADREEEQGKALMAGPKAKKYDLQTTLTLAIVKAATNDSSID